MIKLLTRSQTLKEREKKITGSGTVELQPLLFWCYSFSIQSYLSLSPRQVLSQHLVVLEPSSGGWWVGGGLVVCRAEA
jgi:hypothetical protein